MNRMCASLASVALAAVIVAAAGAQSESNQNQSPPNQGRELVSLNFPGGTVADYVAALKKAAGDVNIVAAIETKDVPMPAVELTDATLFAALSVLDDRGVQLPDRQISLKLRQNRTGGQGERPVYAVEAYVRGKPVDTSTFQRVWSVKHMLKGGAKAEDLLTAVQTSLDLVSDSTKPAQLKFHEATGLIIARASPEQIDAIDQVIGQLDGQFDPSKDRNEKLQSLELELHKCHLAYQDAQQKIEKLERERAGVRKP